MDSQPKNQLNVSVDCVVFGFDENQLKVLLIEQDQLSDTHIPLTALPGDHVFEGEDLDHAAGRVLKELTGLEGVYLKQFHAFGNPNRTKGAKDATWLKQFRKNPDAHIITIGYYSLVRMEDMNPKASSFAKITEWVDVNEIPDLAFDHNEIFEYALRTLRDDTESYHISFELLPKKFTLAQLQHLHELILNRKLDKRNFRKSVKKIEELIPLNEKQKGVFHKPAQLFSFEMPERRN
ncbi:MAG: NUDIX domain-containing protein [Flavobacteriaceae bacterium]|nr:NUDIX domain-containing protein [Flavobacteriaceae bacterium]